MSRVAIVGGGAAGFFAAIACAEAQPGCEVVIFEKSSQPLHKVRISGGGRCNVTHASFEPRDFATRYPRGRRELIAPLHHFGVQETVDWFERRGVRLKTEADGRMFPVTDSSGTVIDCLQFEAKQAGVQLQTRCGVEGIVKSAAGFELKLISGNTFGCDRLLLATGGARHELGARLAESLGHHLEPAVPSLFSFESQTDWLGRLAGVSVTNVEASIVGTKLIEQGALLVTHRGLSGPVVLRLSAWGARALHELDYRFKVRIKWLPGLTLEQIGEQLRAARIAHPNKLVINSPIAPLAARLWEALAASCGVMPDMRWNNLTRSATTRLVAALAGTEIPIDGKSLNKDEFVTCGGVRLREVDFKTMESRITPNLFFAGELLDIDGITGGFNFQSAWTTGWIAGHAMAAR